MVGPNIKNKLTVWFNSYVFSTPFLEKIPRFLEISALETALFEKMETYSTDKSILHVWDKQILFSRQTIPSTYQKILYFYLGASSNMAIFILFQGDAFAINKIPQLPCINFFFGMQ